MVRKKKVYDSEDIPLATDAKSVMNRPTGGWPKISQGSHLTVKTFEDGSTELVWDDAALLRDVQAAILKHESTVSVTTKPKTVRKKKD